MQYLVALVFTVGPIQVARHTSQYRDWARVKEVLKDFTYDRTARRTYIAASIRLGDYNDVMHSIERTPVDRLDKFDILAYSFAAYRLDLPDALTFLKEAHQLFPEMDDFFDFLYLGLYLRKKEFKKAKTVALRAAQRGTNIDRTTVFIFAASRVKASPDDVIYILKLLLPSLNHQDSAYAYLLMARGYELLGNSSLSRAYYKRVLTRFADTKYAVEAIDRVKGMSSQKAKVLFLNRRYRKALKYAPKGSAIRLKIYYKLGRYRDFMRYFKPTISDLRVKLYAARIYEYRGEYRKALRYFFEAMESSEPDVRTAATFEVSNLIIRLRDIKSYARFGSKIIGRTPFHAFRLGIVAYSLGKKKDAIKFFEEAAEGDDRDVKVASLFWLYKLTKNSWFKTQLRKLAPFSYYSLKAGVRFNQRFISLGKWLRDSRNNGYKTDATVRGQAFALLGFYQWSIDEAQAGSNIDRYRIASFASSLCEHWIAMATASLAVDSAKTNLPKELLELAYPMLFSHEIRKYARRYGVDVALVFGLVREESRFLHKVVSPAGAVGLTQVLPKTARKIWKEAIGKGSKYKKDKLYDPSINIKLGVHYLKKLIDEFHSEIFALAGYNAGPPRVYRWFKYMGNSRDEDLFVEMIPYNETRNYVRRVFRSKEIYRKLLKK